MAEDPSEVPPWGTASGVGRGLPLLHPWEVFTDENTYVVVFLQLPFIDADFKVGVRGVESCV